MYKGAAYSIPLLNGRNNNANQARKAPSDLEIALNIALHEGNIQKDFGEVNVNTATLTDVIRAGFDYYATPSSQRTVISTSGGKIQKSSGVGSGAFTDLKTGLTGSAVAQFVQAGRETTNASPKLFWFNGADFPQYITADGSTTERIGFRASLTDAFDTTNASPTLVVNHTAHGLTTGQTVSLVGFTNPINGQNPNVTTATVTVIGANSFSVQAAGNFNATSSGVGGTGKYYAHPVDWTGSSQPSGGVLHTDGRLYAFLGQNLYGSSQNNHADFEAATDTVAGVIYSGVGAEIRAIANFQNLMIVFKYPIGIIQISNIFTTDQASSVLPIQLGIAGKNAFCYTNEGDLLFISQLGSVHSLAAVQEFGDIKASSLTNSAYIDGELKQTIDVSKIDKAAMAYDSYNKVAYAAYTKKGSTYNDFIVKIDLSEGRPRISYMDKGSYVSLWSQKDSSSEDRVISGTSNGWIRNLNSVVRQADGQTGGSYNSIFRLAYTDLKDQYPQFAARNKVFEFLEFNLQPTDTDITLQFNVYVDGSLRFSTSKGFQTAALTFPLTFPLTFSNDDPRDVVIPLTGCYGRRVSLEVINSSSSENFKLSEMRLKFRPGDERILSS